jgi:hypothetical protein
MRLGIIYLWIIAVMLVAGAVPGVAAEGGFNVVFAHYEAIREALIGNSTDGVSAHADEIAVEATKLSVTFDAASAEVAPGDAAAIEAMLPEIRKRAEQLATAKGLAETREAFAALTQPLTRWQKLVDGPRPVVVYCPMEKKAWLQPDEAIGNPYDPSMLRCGKVVQR